MIPLSFYIFFHFISSCLLFSLYILVSLGFVRFLFSSLYFPFWFPLSLLFCFVFFSYFSFFFFLFLSYVSLAVYNAGIFGLSANYRKLAHYVFLHAFQFNRSFVYRHYPSLFHDFDRDHLGGDSIVMSFSSLFSLLLFFRYSSSFLPLPPFLFFLLFAFGVLSFLPLSLPLSSLSFGVSPSPFGASSFPLPGAHAPPSLSLDSGVTVSASYSFGPLSLALLLSFLSVFSFPSLCIPSLPVRWLHS